jgi:predicted small lipoprotein YifL
MTSPFKIIAGAGLALLIAVSLGGCGRRGALEAPPGAKSAPAKAVADEDEDERPTMPVGGGLIQGFTPGTTPSNKPGKNDAQKKATPPAASGSFFLDPLL